MNRRTFLATSAAPLAIGAAYIRPVSNKNTAPDRCTLFQGGMIVDGTGRPAFRGDLLICGDRIVAVDHRVDHDQAEVVDCAGMVVCPGFIDIHGHSDSRIFVNPNAESKVRQGVTTDVGGQDGDSSGPWRKTEARRFAARFTDGLGEQFGFERISGYLDAVAAHPASLNIATMVGTGTVRGYVIGNQNRPATPDERNAMRGLIERALESGACGLSSGLEYVPGAFADTTELIALCRPLSQAGLPYATHMRNEDDRLLSAIEEALFIGRQSGAPVQISHLKVQGERNWWKAPIVLRMLETARAEGVDVMYDRYPYTAYSTGLTNMFPVWSRDGGTSAFLARLNEPVDARRIEVAVRDKVDQLGSWDAIRITSTVNTDLSWAEGHRLGELATSRDQEPYELLLYLVREDRARTSMVGFGMSEANTETLLSHPLGMICSDGGALADYGPLSEGTPHPRSYGTFPRVLGHYCRERRIMSLETAVHKMTAMPARRLRLADRGELRSRAFADLVVFDPETVADRATFAEPHQYPAGIRDVFVNGTAVILDGLHTDARPGRALTPSS